MMPIDVKTEETVPLSKSGHLFPNPKPRRTALWRWAMKGSRGVVLETVLVGTRRMTSQGAVDRFLAATNAPAPAQEPAPVGLTKEQRHRQAETASRILEEAGL